MFPSLVNVYLNDRFLLADKRLNCFVAIVIFKVLEYEGAWSQHLILIMLWHFFPLRNLNNTLFNSTAGGMWLFLYIFEGEACSLETSSLQQDKKEE